ncbi:MAG: hypothetical protein V7L04_03640 [Nostoc sp.]
MQISCRDAYIKLLSLLHYSRHDRYLSNCGKSFSDRVVANYLLPE